MLSGGDFELTAQLYFKATGKQISGEQVVKIITKTFKNQGPYVTKAAVRKTRATIRKMETLCDLKDRLCILISKVILLECYVILKKYYMKGTMNFI